MTRFARAHGSKASNERQPEEATSWNVLKQQLLEQQAASKQKVEEASKPTMQPFVLKKNTSEVTQWAEFEEVPDPSHKKLVKKKEKLGKSEKKQMDKLLSDGHHSSKSKMHKVKNANNIQNDKKLAKMIKKLKLEEVKTLNSDAAEDLGSVVHKVKPEVKLSKREKRKKKRKFSEKFVETSNPDSNDTLKELKTSESVDGSERELTKRQKKRKKHMLKKKQDDGFVLKRPLGVDIKKEPVQAEPLQDGLDKEDEPKLSKSKKRIRNSQLKKQLDSTLNNAPTDEEVETTIQTQSNIKLQVQSKRQKRNLKKLGDPTKVKGRKRRKPQVESTTLIFNGQEIEVTMFDGFPVRKEDADRLKELRKQLIENGIPSKEIEETMKMERRRAEKALSRERRKVCFHCRKGGHNLSDCPELLEGSNQDAAVSGICFKCGSTEHTHFECRVVRGQEFRFAKCFICQEQGHISRQCPDNPRGLYPKGGGCKVCGDVTHLKKDCPDLNEKKEQNAITLDTARGDRIDALDEDLRAEDNRPAVLAPKNKTIKF